MQIEQPDGLSGESFERWLRGAELIRLLHQQGALARATLEVVEPEGVCVQEFSTAGKELLVRTIYETEDTIDAYVLAIQLSMPPGTPFEVLANLVRVADPASVLVTDLVVERRNCHSMIRSSPVAVTILEAADI